MEFAEALSEAIGITARPDKSTETESAINATISLYTTKVNWAKDLVETSLVVDPTLYGATLQFNNVVPTSLVTRFRKFKYVKPRDVKRYLHPIGADKVFTPGEFIQRDVYYVGGNSITYVLRELTPSLEIGYYQFPYKLDLVTNKTHWMLDLMPWAVIDKACARIFRSIGDDTSAKSYESSAYELFTAAKRDFEDLITPEAK
jgi:hypothetical protein